MASNVWDEITYPFPNFSDWTVEVSINLAMLLLKLVKGASDATVYMCMYMWVFWVCSLAAFIKRIDHRFGDTI